MFDKVYTNIEKALLKKFKEKNGRKPTSQELSKIKKKVFEKMKNKTAKDLLKKDEDLEEGLQYVRFTYNGKDATIKHPKVKILDSKYPGIKGQSTYGQREDVLGWSVSHVKNKRYARRAIDEISDFASLLSNSSQEAYRRIKYFYPDQAKFIRRYIKDHITNLKERSPIGLWKKITLSDLKSFKGY